MSIHFGPPTAHGSRRLCIAAFNIWPPSSCRSVSSLSVASSQPFLGRPRDGAEASVSGRHWLEHKTFRTPHITELDTTKPKFYALDMFPYPRYAAVGLHSTLCE